MALAMASASSSSSASVAVEKATSDLLIGPDWTMNIDICDSINSNHWLAKDVVKAVKKRLQHKNPKVQLLALTLLETMVKNCGDFVHFQIVEKNILGEMVRIVRKKADMHVRDKILVLLDSWQEAFGGPGGKHPQYYWAFEELRRSGVEFPKRSLDASPIFTPPVANSTSRHTQAGYGMPVNSSRRLDETMATEFEGLSLSGLESMRNVMELLSDMLQAVNPDDRAAVKDEVIVDLVNRCRSNQKKLMQMLTTTGDEELLGQGLDLNDSLQILLAKHDAIASGSPMPIQITNLAPKPTEGQLSNVKATEVKDSIPSCNANATVPVATATSSHIEEEDEEEDDFAQLARRHSKPQSSPPQSANDASKALVSVETSTATSSSHTTASPAPCNALALPDPPTPVKTTKEQDIIDLLSISLSTSHVTSSPHTPTGFDQSMPRAPASNAQGNPYSSQTFSGNQGHPGFNNYVVPWAQPQQQPQLQHPSQPQAQSQPQFQPQFQPQSQVQPHFQPQHQLKSQQVHVQPQPQQQFQTQSQPQQHPQTQPQPQQQFQPHSQSQLHTQPLVQPHQQQFQPQPQPQQQFQSPPQPQQQFQSQSQPQQQFQSQPQPQQHFQPQAARQFQQQQSHSQYPQYPSGYPPPPWAATPGYANGQSNVPTTSNMITTPQANATASYTPAQASRPLQNFNSMPRVSNGVAINGDPLVSSGPRNPTTGGQKPFIPSYRLFEDLNVLGNSDGRYKVTGSASPSMSGPSTQGMVGGRK